MTEGELMDLLLSDEPQVTIEAPAGCGKTYQAASAAIQVSKTLGRGQEVLLLAHTNGAVQEFRDRVAAAKARVRSVTLDSFALELIRPYADALGLDSPIRPGTPNGPTFAQLTPSLLNLLQRAPTIASYLAAHYPFIILDEHQDARQDQHDAILELARAGKVRVRIFGDPMQAIFSFEEKSSTWEELTANTTATGRLSRPWRWEDRQDLGDWILQARTTLLAGGAVSLKKNSTPESVSILRIAGPWRSPHVTSSRVPTNLIGPLQGALNRLEGSVAILVRNNAHAVGIRTALRGRVSFFEGANPQRAYDVLNVLLEAEGNPVGLGHALVDTLHECSTGLPQAACKTIVRALKPVGISSRSVKFQALLEPLARLYEVPSVRMACSILQEVLTRPLPEMRIHSPETLRILGRLSNCPVDEDLREALDRVARSRRQAARLPHRCVTTVHKAKGREFDHVILVHPTNAIFKDDELSRRILYVGISRPKKSLRLCVPQVGVSPLIEVD